MESIIDNKKDGLAVQKVDGFNYLNGRKHRKKSTKGWHLYIQWKDGSTSWEQLFNIKESNPVKVAKYAKSRGIDDEPDFAWWVEFTLKNREHIIAAINKQYHKRNRKLGIKVPKIVEEAIRFDQENGDTLWQDAIAKETKNVQIAFNIQSGRGGQIR